MNLFCVVDAQYPFVQAEDAGIIEEMAQAVLSAMLRGEHIFLIEDRHGHSTDGRITAMLRDYSRVFRVSKEQWDGSLQIAIKLNELGIVPEQITVCGAYGEQCVIATLSGLRDRYPDSKLAMLHAAIVPAPTQRFSIAQWKNICKRLEIELIEQK